MLSLKAKMVVSLKQILHRNRLHMAELLELSPEVLTWAAGQTGETLGEVARKVSKRKPELVEEGKLSQAQIVKFAKVTGVPFGYLFLSAPPAQRKLPIADFRTLTDPAPLGKNFFDIYDDIDFKLSWYRGILRDHQADPLPFIGKFGANSNPVSVATDMRKTLGVSQQSISSLKTSDEVFSHIAARAEEQGILIFKNSQAGGSWARPLSVSEFRGFVLSDQWAPAVFINGADAPAAWVFTLAHELAHLWFGDSGVSDVSIRSENKQERLCNSVAAEFLVPADDFRELWDSSPKTIDEKLGLAKKEFKVSALVTARRAHELGLITNQKYQEIYELVRHNAAKPKEPGGDFYRTLAVRNSKRFTDLVSQLAASGGMTFREAGQLLNINPNKVMTYYAKNRPLLA
jgi:Zn-dependent peptidase ImmA (M78 family)